MAKYQIRAVARGTTLHYYVHKALGPWPFKNWSWGSVFDADTHEAAEKWIADTQFTESPEGQRIARQVESLKAKTREEAAAYIQSMIGQGWHYDAHRHVLIKDDAVIPADFMSYGVPPRPLPYGSGPSRED